MRVRSVLLCSLVAALGLAQLPNRPSADPNAPEPRGSEARLPNGKLQRDEIIKAEYKKSLEDADELIKLAQDLKADLEKNTAFVVSIPSIKKTEDIEKLAKRIRGRMKRG